MQINFTGQAVNKLSAIDSFFASLERSSAADAPAMASASARIRRGGCVAGGWRIWMQAGG
jgi:hypothetical protein